MQSTRHTLFALSSLCKTEYAAQVTLPNAQTMLRELARLDRTARRPRTEVWFPLLVFGLIDVPGIILALVIGREHLGLYFLPMSVFGGVLCAWHYRRRGRTTGLQAPALAWMLVVIGVIVAGAACSATGRDRGWDLLNLGGPAVSRMAGYSILAIWARSTALLVVVGAIGATTLIVLAFARGNTAISLQLAGFSSAMLLLAAINWLKVRLPE